MFEFKSKVENLIQLKDSVSSAKILDIYFFSIIEWKNDKNNIIENIVKMFKKNIIVRSSARDEDQLDKSNAGKYTSVLDVDILNRDKIEDAIEKVIMSYKEQKELNKNYIFIQEMVKNVVMSGVIFSFDIENLMPYYIISINDKNNQTDVVTAGKTNSIKNIYVLDNGKHNFNKYSNIIKMIRELIEITKCNKIDVEFAVDKNNEIIILQIRKLVVKNNESSKKIIEDIYNINLENKNRGNVSGKIQTYNNMTDWNPAELVGKHPKPLDYSIYCAAFTEGVWSNGRKLIGYKELDGQTLTKLILGYAFVDVRLDFNSYLPKGLTKNLEDKIIDFYIAELIEKKELYDKAEFNIVETCYTLSTDMSRFRKSLQEKEVEEYAKKLLEMTNNIICDKYDVIKKIILEFNRFSHDYDKNDINSIIAILRKKLSLWYTTIVRCAFIGYKQFIDLVELNLITKSEFNKLFNSLSTIVSKQKKDILKMKKGELKIEEFVNKYKYIRENMFDVSSISKYENKEFINYLLKNKDYIVDEVNDYFFQNKEIIDKKLVDMGFSFDIKKLAEFTLKSFYYREEIKFEISKCMYWIAEIIKKKCNDINVNIDDIRYVGIEFLEKCSSEEKIKEQIRVSKKKYYIENGLHLPDVISNIEDVLVVEELKKKPNYVGELSIRGKTIFLSNNYTDYKSVKNKIVVIEKADPGYDWLFNCGIIGLITKYGGVASHMALRAYELAIPAAIGIGDELFEKIKDSEILEIDCKKKCIKGDYFIWN